jgi:predicted HicB family RNase H-like nuclease
MADRDPRRPRGRPRADPHSSISVWVEASVHDQLIERAKQQEQSLSKTVRELLAAKLTGD